MRRHHGRALSPFAGRTPSPPSAEVSLVRNFDHELNPARPVRQSPLATSQFQGMPLDLIDRIRSFPLFKTAPDAFLYEVGLVLKPQMYAPNDYIMTEGDDAKAMYWIVRGAVAVTSRDGESTYAELKPGSFVGEIGILMDRPRTATVIARTRCLGLQLKKEDLRRILPRFPDVERAIREEALERLAILEKKKKQQTLGMQVPYPQGRRSSKRARESSDSSTEPHATTASSNHKRRKSPSPDVIEVPSISALGHGLVNVRTLLKELPLFSNLPPEPLHFLGLNAQPRSFSPFTEIIKQNSSGREVFFIVHGEVEVVIEHPEPRGRRSSTSRHAADEQTEIVARLKSGQYFGEVVSLSLASKRTATVRSVTTVECLVIPEAVLQEFWENVPAAFKRHMESTAKRRLRTATVDDVVMTDNTRPLDMTKLGLDDDKMMTNLGRPPKVTFNDAEQASPLGPPQDDPSIAEPLDPDPFQSQGLDNVRARSRRGSLAPLSPDEAPSTQMRTNRRSPRHSPNASPLTSPTAPSTSPMIEGLSSTAPFLTSFTFAPRPQQPVTSISGVNRGPLPDDLLELVFSRLGLPELMRLQCVCYHWRHILTRSDKLCTYLNLSQYNRQITDAVLIHKICPFVGSRPRTIDMTNCFHVTDEGFLALAEHCAVNVKSWYMKSVWEVSAAAMLEMANRAKNLVEIDLSNCRKVSDVLLARMVGWIVPALPATGASRTTVGRPAGSRTRPRAKASTVHVNVGTPPAGTIIGCPKLRQIRLSYCKHVTDRTMHHFAMHASNRLVSLDLTRCTTITDVGFSYWSQDNIKFTKLSKLVLADCTYLSDQAIIYLTNAAGQSLRHLDLSFCCALSDTATEVIALGCPTLERLDMSFCGSAISDASLKSMGRHLTNLRSLSVRGCVRVTGVGIDAVVSGCTKITHFNISQCKHTLPWIESGGEHAWRVKGRPVIFESEINHLRVR